MEELVLDGRPINLTQVLKLAGWADNGALAKTWIADGLVLVNGAVELRKRRQMAVGDVVALHDGPTLRLVAAPAP